MYNDTSTNTLRLLRENSSVSVLSMTTEEMRRCLTQIQLSKISTAIFYSVLNAVLRPQCASSSILSVFTSQSDLSIKPATGSKPLKSFVLLPGVLYTHRFQCRYPSSEGVALSNVQDKFYLERLVHLANPTLVNQSSFHHAVLSMILWV